MVGQSGSTQCYLGRTRWLEGWSGLA